MEDSRPAEDAGHVLLVPLTSFTMPRLRVFRAVGRPYLADAFGLDAVGIGTGVWMA